jgi:hypothetical protein
MMCSTVSSNFLQSLHLLTVSVCNIFIAWYLVYKAVFCVAIISLSVSLFRSPLQSHRHMSSSLISCLSLFLTYWPRIILLSHFYFKDFRNFAFICWMPSFFASLFSFDWFNCSATFAATLIVQFIYGWLLLWLLTIWTNWSSIYFVFKYSAILIISAWYVASIYNRPHPLSFLFTYSLSLSAFGWCILYIVCTFIVFLPTFLISSSLRLIIIKLYLNTRIANAPIAVILFLAFNSDFSIFLISWCIPSSIFLSFVDVRPHVLQFLAICMFSLVQAIVFLRWSKVLNFVSELVFLWIQSLHTYQV